MLLQVHELTKDYQRPAGLRRGAGPSLRAVDQVSFDLPAGRTLGLVGESGAGKSTVGRLILRLIPASSGRVYFEGHDVFALSARRLRPLRRWLQIIFQDPLSSLNPRMTVEQIVGEGLAIARLARGRQLRERVAQALDRVGLSPDHRHRYPHEFSVVSDSGSASPGRWCWVRS